MHVCKGLARALARPEGLIIPYKLGVSVLLCLYTMVLDRLITYGGAPVFWAPLLLMDEGHQFSVSLTLHKVNSTVTFVGFSMKMKHCPIKSVTIP